MMSLIPWISTGDKKTITTEYEDFKIDGNIVWLDNLESAQFKEEGATNASYDLRIGRHYRMYSKTRTQTLEVDDSFKLPPGSAAVVETKERVFFPKSIFGLIVPKETKLRDGVSIPPTKVDPGYPDKKDRPKRTGYLHVTIFNHGTKPYILKHGERFCALCLFQAADGAIPYGKGEKELYGGPPLPSLWHRLVKHLQANFWMILTFVVAAAAAAVGILGLICNSD